MNFGTHPIDWIVSFRQELSAHRVDSLVSFAKVLTLETFIAIMAAVTACILEKRPVRSGLKNDLTEIISVKGPQGRSSKPRASQRHDCVWTVRNQTSDRTWDKKMVSLPGKSKFGISLVRIKSLGQWVQMVGFKHLIRERRPCRVDSLMILHSLLALICLRTVSAFVSAGILRGKVTLGL